MRPCSEVITYSDNLNSSFLTFMRGGGGGGGGEGREGGSKCVTKWQFLLIF